jgi:hypothetical protein
VGEIKWKVTGVEELSLALHEVAREAPEIMDAVTADVAAGAVEDARRLVPHRSGRAASSYRSRGHVVSIGAGVPYVPWLEFGGDVGRKGATHRAKVKGGRYFYPSLTKRLKDIEDIAADMIEQMTNIEVD